MKPSPDGKYWGNAFRPDEQPLIPKGQWICAEFMLKHNTPGQSDGEQVYVTDRWTKQKVNIVDFDNVVIAKEYIGPAGSGR